MILHTARNRFRTAALLTALALPLGDCGSSPTGGGESSPPPGNVPAAWRASCDVVSCEFPGNTLPCLVDRNAAVGALVPVAATLVFRGRIDSNGAPLPAAPYRFAWNFGDGQTALPPATNALDNLVQHVYQSASGHSVEVTVTDAQGFSATGKCQVTTAADPPLAVECSASPDRGPAPLTVAFDARKFNCVGECPFTWNFGDGSSPSTGGSIEHKYTLPGTYTATGTLRDSRGQSRTCTRTIAVTGPAVTPGSAAK